MGNTISKFLVLVIMVSCVGPNTERTKTNKVKSESTQETYDVGPEEEVVTEFFVTMDGRHLNKEEYQKYSDSVDVVIKKFRKEFDSREIDY